MAILSLKVPQETAARLARLASRRRVSKSEILRHALERTLRGAEEESTPSAFELLARSLGVVDSGVGDLASNKRHLSEYGRRKTHRR